MRSNTEDDITNDIPERVPRYFNMYRNRVYTMNKRNFYRRVRGEAKIKWDYMRLKAGNMPDKAERLKIMRDGIDAGKKFNPIIEFPNEKSDVK